MENNEQQPQTEVIFRKDKSGIFALFPHEVADYKGNVTSYQHIGQHSSADYNHCIRNSKVATPEQYADLQRELKGIGYDLKIVQKQNYKKYLKSYMKN
jgi:hypothetical protein